MQRRDDPEDKEFMATLAKGLAVLGAFGRQRPAMTLSEVCRAEWSNVFPVPRILDFGFAYLSTQSWIDRALPLMREVSERLGESCSAAILQGNDIVYVARVPARRIMSAALSVGSRLPALHTALGRILFGFLDEAEIWRRLKSQRIEAYSPQTITDLQALYDRIRADHEQQFAIVDEELERGLRALAVPVIDRTSQAVSAINLSTHSTRTTRNEMRDRFLPELKRITGQISSTTV